MDVLQLDRLRSGKGFIAALDQSGESTPKALELYGITNSEYKNELELFDRVHEIRTRIITNHALQARAFGRYANPRLRVRT